MHSLNKTRRSNRGVKMCPKCKTLNGHRSLHCKNVNCSMNVKGSLKSFKKSTPLFNDLIESKMDTNINFQNSLSNSKSSDEVDIKNKVNLNYINSVKPSDDCLYMDWDNAFSDLSTSVKFPNHNALLEIHTESVSELKMEKKSTYQLNDIILVEADKNSCISDVCDALFAESIDNKNENPIDIQIMLAESSDLESSDLRLPRIEETYSLLSKSKSKDCARKKSNPSKSSNHYSMSCKYGNQIKPNDDTDNNFDTRAISDIDNELLFLNLSRSEDYYITTSYNEEEVLSIPHFKLNHNVNNEENKTNSTSMHDINSPKVQNVSNTHSKNKHNKSKIIKKKLDKTNEIESQNFQNLNKALFSHSAVYNTNENKTNLPFIQWLSSVTEKLNQTMHFQFNGTPKPLTYQIPHFFFECICDRMSEDTKKRLPNTVTQIHRNDTLPLGKFTKYTWKILKINQIMKIFHTPNIPLKVLQYFKQNSDGSFTNIETPKVTKEKIFNDNKNVTNIQPGYLITYLKIGKISEYEKMPTPFCIEWIPDILPVSKVGELTLRFQYGHKSNYHP